jgi:hypothetical protein
MQKLKALKYLKNKFLIKGEKYYYVYCDRFPILRLSLLFESRKHCPIAMQRICSTVGTLATVSWTENRSTAMQCTSTTEVSKATKVLLRQPRIRRVEVITRSKSVIGQSSRRGDIKRSYSLASEEGRHKELSASLRGVRTSKHRSDTRHQGVRSECNRMIVISTRGVGNKRVWTIEWYSL